MPYYLACAGDPQHITLASNISWGAFDPFVVEFKVAILDNTKVAYICGRATNNNETIQIDRPTNQIRANFGSFINFALPLDVDVTLPHTYRIERDINEDWTLYIDDVLQPETFNQGSSVIINYLLASNTPTTNDTPPVDLYFIQFSKLGSVISRFDAIDTSTGSTIPDTVGSNSGTLVNFPVDDSQWVSYGGGSIEITPSVINSSSVSLSPAVSVVVLLSITGSVVNSQALSLNPSIALAVNVNVDAQLANSNAVALSPTISVVGRLDVSGITVNSSSIAQSPDVVIGGAVSVNPATTNTSSIARNPTIVIPSVLIINGQTVNTSSIANGPTVALVNVVVVNPNPINSQSLSNDPTIQLFGRLEIIGNVLSSSSLSNDPTVVSSFGFDVFEQSVNSASTSNNPSIVIGEVVITALDETNISLRYFSTNIDIVDLSRNINV
jgi:hypothetical protein